MSTSELPVPASPARPPLLPYTRRDGLTLLGLLALLLLLDWLLGVLIYCSSAGYGSDSTLVTQIYLWLRAHEDFWVGCYWSAFSAQFLFLILGVTLFRGSVILRISLGTGLLILGAAWTFYWSTENLEDVGGPYSLLAPGTVLLIPFFCGQLPFWLIGWWFGLRVVRRHEAAQVIPRDRRFGLLDLFGWSAFLAVPLAVIQGMMREMDAADDTWAFAVFGSVAVGLTMVGALVAGLTSLWLFFVTKRPIRATLAASLVYYVFTVVALAVISALQQRTFRLPTGDRLLPIFFAAFGFLLGALCVLLPVLFTVRLLGWCIPLRRAAK